MKELSIEEKAKRYDEAFDRARKLKEEPTSVFYEYSPSEGDTVADYIFPELKESEDERIIKALYKMAKVPRKEIYEADGITKEQALAWLEKQGEQKETLCDKCKKAQPSHSCQDITALGRCALEKQDEQKLTEFEKAVKQVMEEAIECGDTHNLKADADMLLSLIHKSAWSEEDDIMKQNCHQMLALLRPNSSELIKDIIDNCHHWLKSLKDRVQPQSTWKPSDEQIKTLENVRKILHSKDIYSKVKSLMYNFEELIRTITKLKE